MVCAPSNAAIDEIAARILKSGLRDSRGGRYDPKIIRVVSFLLPKRPGMTVSPPNLRRAYRARTPNSRRLDSRNLSQRNSRRTPNGRASRADTKRSRRQPLRQERALSRFRRRSPKNRRSSRQRRISQKPTRFVRDSRSSSTIERQSKTVSRDSTLFLLIARRFALSTDGPFFSRIPFVGNQ